MVYLMTGERESRVFAAKSREKERERERKRERETRERFSIVADNDLKT